jgi:hypothetical protein
MAVFSAQFVTNLSPLFQPLFDPQNDRHVHPTRHPPHQPPTIPRRSWGRFSRHSQPFPAPAQIWRISTTVWAVLPSRPRTAPATRTGSRRLSEVRRPTPPAVGGLRPPLCAEGALLGAGGEPRTRRRSRRFSEVRRPTPPALRRAPAPFGLRPLGAGGEPRTRPPSPDSRLPASGPPGVRLPASRPSQSVPPRDAGPRLPVAHSPGDSPSPAILQPSRRSSGHVPAIRPPFSVLPPKPPISPPSAAPGPGAGRE